jgi:hypothetical protein
VARDGGSEVCDGEADVVASALVQTEDISVRVWGVVNRSDEVLQRGARVVRQLGEEDLRFFFCKSAHPEQLKLAIAHMQSMLKQ